MATFPLLLQGCGGGSSPEEPQAKPDGLLSAGASQFEVAEVSRYINTFSSSPLPGAEPLSPVRERHLVVVDLKTGQAVWSTDVSGDDAPSPIGFSDRQWTRTTRVSLDRDASGYTNQGASQLVYIDGGRLMQLNLTGGTLGEPRQIASEVACSVRLGLTLDEAGTDGWLQVRTVEPGGSCTDAEGSVERWIRMGESAPATSKVADKQVEFLNVLLDRQLRAQGILVANHAGSTLSLEVRSTDLTQVLQTIPVPGGLAPDTPVHWASSVQFDSRATFIMIGSDLHRIMWQGGRLTLSAALLPSNKNDYPALSSYGQMSYSASGCTLYQIDGAGKVSPLADLPKDAGPIVSVDATPEHIVTLQRAPSPAYVGGEPVAATGCDGQAITKHATLRALTRSTKAVRTLKEAASSTEWGEFAVGYVGNRLYTVSYDAGANTVTRYDLNTGKATTMAQGVQIIEYVISPRHSSTNGFNGDLSEGQLMWCTGSASNSYACEAGSTLTSFLPKTEELIPLGQLPKDADLPAAFSGEAGHLYRYLSNGAPAFQPGILSISTNYSSLNGSLYQIKPIIVTPGIPDSLREILSAP